MEEQSDNRNHFVRALILPLIIIGLLWVVKLIELSLDVSWYQWGIYPRTLEGLPGIITGSFIHGDLNHLFSNSIPLLVTSAMILYFYRGIALKVFLWIFFLNGVSVWLFARSSWHIGISGLVYGLVTFLFFSGLFRKDKRMMAISLLMVFLYGGMIWGVMPVIPGVSWESHLLGSIAGMICAWMYRDYGPQRPVYDYEYDDDDDEEGNKQEEWDAIYRRYQQ